MMAHRDTNRSSFTYFVVLITLLASSFVILRFASFSNPNPESVNFDGWESHPLKAVRASQGDQYLLGVGKADITG
jgi:hypothetical protein